VASIADAKPFEESQAQKSVSEIKQIQSEIGWMPPPPPEQNGKHETLGAMSMANYIIKVGRKYKNKTLQEVGKDGLEGYLNWLYDEQSKDGKPFQPMTQEFVDIASEYVLSLQKNEPKETDQSERLN